MDGPRKICLSDLVFDGGTFLFTSGTSLSAAGSISTEAGV